MGYGLEERDWLCALAGVKGLGRRTLWQLYEHCGSFAAVAGAGGQHRQLPLPSDVRAELARLDAARVARDKAALEAAGTDVICFWEESFPTVLREIPDPPLLVYCRGDRSLLQAPVIAVVGSRKPTPYGRAACQSIASGLAEAGVVIASGLAQGIDAEAHAAALKAGGGTIAVLGCGVDVVYPRHHAPLYGQIARSGLLLSEYPPGTSPRPGLFPERNRLISALSLGVVVVEAAERSGSLITADCALEQGRDVFAVPGPIFAKNSAGPHNLIKQGAKIVTNWQDVLEEYPELMRLAAGRTAPRPEAPLDEGERLVAALLSSEPIHWDELCAALPREARASLHRDLLRLEAKGIAASLPGGWYVKKGGFDKA